jgi:hypothetical protein
VRVVADDLGRFDAIHFGHPYVHQHDVRIGPSTEVDPSLAVLGVADHA